MEADTRITTAARVAARFHLDPMVVLDASSRHWLVRVAAYNVAVRDDERARAAAEKATG